MTYSREESQEAVARILERVSQLGYTEESNVPEGASHYTHAFVLEDGATKKVVRFHATCQKVDLFHGVFSHRDGSRTLHTFRIKSDRKLNEVLHKIG